MHTQGIGLFPESKEHKNYLTFGHDVESKNSLGDAIIYIWRSRKRFCLCFPNCCCSARKKRFGQVSMQLVNKNGHRIKDGYISIWPAKYQLWFSETIDEISLEGVYHPTIILVGRDNKKITYFIEDGEFVEKNSAVLRVEIEVSRNELNLVYNKNDVCYGLVDEEKGDSKTINKIIERALSAATHPRRLAEFPPELNADRENEEKELYSIKYYIHDVNVKEIYRKFQGLKKEVIFNILGSGLFKRKNIINCSGLIIKLLLEHGSLLIDERVVSFSHPLDSGKFGDIITMSKSEKVDGRGKIRRCCDSMGETVCAASNLFFFLIFLTAAYIVITSDDKEINKDPPFNTPLKYPIM